MSVIKIDRNNVTVSAVEGKDFVRIYVAYKGKCIPLNIPLFFDTQTKAARGSPFDKFIEDLIDRKNYLKSTY